MDAKKLGNTPAFACGADGGCGPWPGMTMRHLFAKDIFCAILSRNPSAGVGLAVEHADALLAELAREAM